MKLIDNFRKKKERQEIWDEDNGEDQGAREINAQNTSGEASPELRAMEAIRRLSESLIRKRDIAVRERAACGIEQVWREDEAAIEGIDEMNMRTRMIDYATQSAPLKSGKKGPKRSQVVINITRPKCETAEGRFADIQLPTDDKNWGLKTTPVPEMTKGFDNDKPARKASTKEPIVDDETGAQKTVSEVAYELKKEADERMMGMETEINDQLTECDYNGESRKLIQDAVRLGTGILKGPIVVKSLKKHWKKVDDNSGPIVRVLEWNEDQRPASKSKDPWDVFPDPECEDDISRAAYIWDREPILPRELRALLTVDGYITSQIERVLAEEPMRVIVAEPKDNHYVIKYNIAPKGHTYEKWEYNGDLDREDLEALGCDCDSIKGKSLSGCVVMVNDHPIKVMLNPVDTGEINFDFFQWSQRSGVPWGMGVPRQMMWQQRIVIAAWRAMMDNAGDSSGANIIVGGGVEPMDGNWEITGKKLWRATGDQNDVKKAFIQFQIENNQEQLQAIIELALRFVDMETTMPMIFSGEKGELPETLGATNILIDSNNVAFRTRVKLYDDRITRPHITRYYDWNMQYNPKEEIKGDWNVDPRGISILKERDQQAQTIEELMQLRQDAELKILIDWEKALKQLLSAKNLDVMKSSDDITKDKKRLEEQPPPLDPALEAAKIRSEAELKKAQLVQDADMAELEFKAEEAKIDREHEMNVKLLEREIKAMELSATTGIALDKIKAQLSEVAVKLKTQVKLAQAKEVQPAEQVAEPIAEPAGRAPEGQAFQA